MAHWAGLFFVNLPILRCIYVRTAIIFKDSLNLRVLGVYRILCISGACYIGQMGRSIDERCIEHQIYLQLGQTLASHEWKTGHSIYFDKVKILFQSPLWSLRTI